MEKKQETRKTKSLTQKAKKIRSVVMMTLLCVLLMSAATYAWFTLSKTAKASNLTMTVGDVTGLQISDDNTTWSGEIELGEIKANLMPSTYVKEGTWSFYEPVYNDAGKITGIKKLDGESGKITKDTPDTTKYGYYYERTFYLQSLGENADVYLAKGIALDSDRIKDANSTVDGTYIEINGTKQSGDLKGLAPAAIRISFQVNGSDPVVYAPFNDVTDTGTAAAYANETTYSMSTNSSKRPNIVANQNSSGTYGTSNSEKSEKLFTLTADTSTLVTMCVWIEGDDAQCVNQIQLEKLIGQLVFTSETASTT